MRFEIGYELNSNCKIKKQMGFKWPLTYFHRLHSIDVKLIDILAPTFGPPAREMYFINYSVLSYRTILTDCIMPGWDPTTARWYIGSVKWQDKYRDREKWIVFRTERDRDIAHTLLSLQMEQYA